MYAGRRRRDRERIRERGLYRDTRDLKLEVRVKES